MTDKDVLAIHFKYCMFIAVMIFIAIATEKWSSSKDFTTYLSNAATMTSLFLGVIAILYSFVSNDSMARSLGSINTVTDQVREVKGQIAEYVRLTANSTQAVQSSGDQIRDASGAISGSLSNLDDTLQQLAIQNQELRTLLGALPTRMEELETKVGDVAKAVGEKPISSQTLHATAPAAATGTAIGSQTVTSFLDRATLNQNLLTYACVLSYQTKKPLSIPDFCNAVSFNGPSGLQGFLSCMNAVQLCWRKQIEGQDSTFAITFIHTELVNQAESYFLNYIDENYSNKLIEKTKWLEKLSNVRKLYQVPPSTS